MKSIKNLTLCIAFFFLFSCGNQEEVKPIPTISEKEAKLMNDIVGNYEVEVQYDDDDLGVQVISIKKTNEPQYLVITGKGFPEIKIKSFYIGYQAKDPAEYTVFATGEVPFDGSAKFSYPEQDIFVSIQERINNTTTTRHIRLSGIKK